MVRSLEETLFYIADNHCSVSRYGDGEIKLVLGKNISFQPSSPQLQALLSKILIEKTPNHIVCIPNIFGSLNNYQAHDKKYWKEHLSIYRRRWYHHLDTKRVYYDAFISRCYMPYIDKSKSNYFFDLWKKIWEQKDLLIVEGEKTRLGVGNDLFHNTNSIKRILCPNTKAFTYYPRLLEEIKKYHKKHLVLLAIGPTATIIASDLAKEGYQAIDIGHIDIEYEWYLQRADHKIPIKDKFVNEAGGGRGVGDINDMEYKSQIVCQF